VIACAAILFTLGVCDDAQVRPKFAAGCGAFVIALAMTFFL